MDDSPLDTERTVKDAQFARDVFTANPETVILLLTVLVWRGGGRATITQREMDMLADYTIKAECLGCFDACQLSISPPPHKGKK